MMNFFQVTPTELHLNGPNVGFTTVPQDVSVSSGIATFVAIGTATFPYNSTDGSFGFQWYFDNKETLNSSSNTIIETNSGISTLTLTGLTDLDSGKEIYSVVRYIPGPDEAIIDYPAEGIGRSTSPSATLLAPPSIVISNQPTSVVIGAGNTASFDVEASVVPGGGSIQYQWNLEGINLTNGSSTRTVQDSGVNDSLPSMQVTSDKNDVFNLNWNELTTFNGFVPHRTYTLTVTGGDLTTTLTATGAGGGKSRGVQIPGGRGGKSTGKFTFKSGQVYKLRIGGATADTGVALGDVSSGAAGFSGGGRSFISGVTVQGGGGGGFTGLFEDSITQANAIIIAGGGGGGAWGNGASANSNGGNGGGLVAGDGETSISGTGGTQSAGGTGGLNNGAALQGGDGAAGGGGGYFGGSGGTTQFGGTALGGNDGAGGGGSGFLHATKITEGTTINGEGGFVGTTTVNADINSGNGTFTITRVATTKEVVTRVSGANTSNLKIYTDDQDFGGSLKCVMTATGVLNSPLDSSVVSYDVVKPRIILLFEAFDTNNNIKTTRQDLGLTGSFAVTSNTFGSDYSIIQFTSVEKNSSLTLELRGAAGTSNGSNAGGEGGVASINVEIKKNEEYTIIGVADNTAVYLYEKSSLIAVVGQGGDASTGGVGGAGGGINVGGDDGTGTNQGLGGDVPDLSLTGVFGSVVNNSSNQPTLYTGDSIATVPDGGRTVICSKGSYYVNQGINPCSDISTGVVQFRSIDGTLVSDSSSLLRGFKPGYTVTETQGQSSATGGGNGGAGAQGGSGSRSNTAGGGGGSGWTNRTSSLVRSQLGGNATQFASVVFNPNTAVEDSSYYVDAFGRILIYSWGLTNPKDSIPATKEDAEPASKPLNPSLPRTFDPIANTNTITTSRLLMEKTTGKVLPTDEHKCIDDARWRAILDKARDGTQNWRLSATRWNDPRIFANAHDKNIYRMMRANVYPLETGPTLDPNGVALGRVAGPPSLSSWLDAGYARPTRPTGGAYYLASDEVYDGDTLTYGDYSQIRFEPDMGGRASGQYGYRYSGQSTYPFFKVDTGYSIGANFWILPPGVPEFTNALPTTGPDGIMLAGA
tara:strand:+ start:15385 stop:18669 length:3285 start_codon:yes stop_codon:yes gene_type:complete